MAVSEMDFVDVLANIDDLSLSQSYKVLLALKQNPPEGVNVIQEAMASFESLEDLEVVEFFKQMRARFDEDEWFALTED